MILLNLLAPVFGNRWDADLQIEPKRSIGGELRVAVDPNWPVIETLTIRYENFSPEIKDIFVTAVRDCFGEEVQMTDWEGNTWIGTVTSDLTVEQPKRGCGFALSFDFQGIKQP